MFSIQNHRNLQQFGFLSRLWVTGQYSMMLLKLKDMLTLLAILVFPASVVVGGHGMGILDSSEWHCGVCEIVSTGCGNSKGGAGFNLQGTFSPSNYLTVLYLTRFPWLSYHERSFCLSALCTLSLWTGSHCDWFNLSAVAFFWQGMNLL